MTDTAKRAGPTLLTTTSAPIYSPTTTGNVLNVHIANDAAVAVGLAVSIGADALGTRLFPDGFQVPAKGTADYNGFMPILAGESIYAHASANSSLTISIGAVETT